MIPIAERHARVCEQSRGATAKRLECAWKWMRRNEKMNAKIREHAMQKVPFLLVVGDKEAEAGKVNVRTRGKEKTGRHGRGRVRRENSGADRGKERSAVGTSRLT